MDKEVRDQNRKLNAFEFIWRVIGLFTMLVASLFSVSFIWTVQRLTREGFSLEYIMSGELPGGQTVSQGSDLNWAHFLITTGIPAVIVLGLASLVFLWLSRSKRDKSF